MFKTKKTRSREQTLQQALELYATTNQRLSEMIEKHQQAEQQAQQNAEQRDRALSSAEWWKRDSECWKSRCQQAVETLKPLRLNSELEARLDAAFLKACGIESLDKLVSGSAVN
jgi:hypothetical protein